MKSFRIINSGDVSNKYGNSPGLKNQLSKSLDLKKDTMTPPEDYVVMTRAAN